MDWFPLLNTVRAALAASVPVVLLAAAAAYCRPRLPRGLRAAADVLLTLPLFLTPTATGCLLLLLLGPGQRLGWPAAAVTAAVAAFPVMYHAARVAFDGFDERLSDAARTLGLPDLYIFWRIRVPCCKWGLLTGAVLTVGRAMAEFGATAMFAGCVPGQTAVLSTEITRLWLAGEKGPALRWVLLDLLLSAGLLLAAVLLSRRERRV